MPTLQCPRCRSSQPIGGAFCATCGQQLVAGSGWAKDSRKYDPVAWLSLICGVIGIWLFTIPLSALAIAFGIVSIIRLGMERNLIGYQQAIVGTLLGAGALYWLWTWTH